MRLLIIDPFPDGAVGSLDLAWRAKRSGHEVKYYLRRSKRNEHVGLGMVDCVDDFQKWLLWADLVFYSDNTAFLDSLERAKREDGQSIIAPSKEAASWELDREHGMQMFKKNGIRVPEYKKFSNYDAAIAHVKTTLKRYVSKPCADVDKSLTYCSKSPQDMIFMLERWKATNTLKCEFILQEFHKGIEMAVGGWIGHNGFIEGWCENFEFKKLMAGDLGVQTGEQGTVLKYVKKSKLAAKVLKPAEKDLVDSGSCCYIDVNCIIDEFGDVWPLEWTCREGWPTFNIQQVLNTTNCVDWIKALADGGDPKQFNYTDTAIGVVVAIPDYPYSHYTARETEGIPIYGLTPKNEEFFHPCAVMQGKAPFQEDEKIVEKPCLVTAGDYVCVVTAAAPTIVKARSQVYRRVEALEIPRSPMWRIDIGLRLKHQLPELQRHGFATEFTYK